MAINLPIEEDDVLNFEMESPANISIDHRTLTNRDASEQHPISAITGLQGALNSKVDKVEGKGLSTNDYTNADKTKLAGVEAGAEVNVQSDWSQSDSTADDYIKNKPNIPSPQVNADWNATSGVAEILNKPTIPTKTSQLQNDSGFLTEHQSLANYDTKSEVNAKISNATNDMATETWVESQGYLTEHQSLSAYRTSAEQDVIDNTKASASDVDAIEEKIPSQATSENQLADKNFVNSSIATETAHYISNNGQPFTSVAELEAYTGTVTNNDYAFVTGTDEQGNTYFDRYKASVSGSTVTWAKEYRLNNSSFTAQQWASISSGITSGDVALIGTAIQPTDYASASNTGVLKVAPQQGFGVTADGTLYPTVISQSQWSGQNNSFTVSKGTLESIREDLVSRSLQTNSQITTTAQKKAICNTIGAQFDGQFELIEEITLTEDTAIITRTQDTQGNAYNFKALIIKIIATATDSTKFIVFDFINNNSYQVSIFAGISTYNRFSFVIANCHNNMLICESKSGAGSEKGDSDLRACNDSCVNNVPSIQYLKMFVYGGSAIPTGTNIKIYGVWA